MNQNNKTQGTKEPGRRLSTASIVLVLITVVMVLLGLLNLDYNPGWCFGLLLLAVPIGLTASVMAGISVAKNSSKWKKNVFALAAGLVPLAMLILIPAFLRHLAREKQEGAKSNLEAVHELQKAYKAEHGAYAASFGELGFKQESPYREGWGYLIIMGDDSVGGEDWVDLFGGEDWIEEHTPPELETYAGESKFKAMAVRNIDGDETADIWTIDETGRLVNVVDDVME